jgi:hypothetical protein
MAAGRLKSGGPVNPKTLQMDPVKRTELALVGGSSATHRLMRGTGRNLAAALP